MPTSRAFEKPAKRQAALNGLATRPVKNIKEAVEALNARFDSFAATVQNRIDTDAGGPLTLTGSLDAQVQRALSQALRRGGAYQNQTAATLGSYQPPTTLTPSAYSAASGAYTAGGYLAPTSGYSASTAPPASGIPAIASVMTGLPPDQSVLVRE